MHTDEKAKQYKLLNGACWEP